MTDIFLTIEDFAKYEGLSPNTVRTKVPRYTQQRPACVLPPRGRGQKGGAMLSSALLSSQGRKKFLGDPHAAAQVQPVLPTVNATPGAAQRQDAPVWLPLRVAVRFWRVGNERISKRTLRRWICQGKIARGKWRMRNGSYELYLTALPETAQIAYYLDHGLALPQRLQRPHARTGNLGALTATQRQIALAWGQRLSEFDRLLRETGWTKRAAAQAYCDTNPELTLGKLLPRYAKWIAAGRDVAVLAPKPRSGRPLKTVSQTALLWMYRHFVDSNMPNKRLSARATTAKARVMGWQPIPSLDTLVRYLDRMPANVRIAKQGGAKALDDTYLPGTLRAYDMPAMEVWVGDHHQFDVIVRMPDGTPARLWVTVWQDMRSRKFVGWTIVLQPNSESIATAFLVAAKQYGAPKVLLIDNGADYTCYKLIGTTWQKARIRVVNEHDDKRLRGAFEVCGVQQIMRAIEYNAESKPVERTFRTHEEQFCAQLDGYCGRTHQERKRLEDRLGHRIEDGPLLDADTFVAMYERYVTEVYHTAAHSGEGMQGRSPNHCFQDERVEATYVPAENLDVLFLTPVERTIGRFGFRLFGQYYRTPDLQHAYFDPKHRRKFLVRYNPKDLSTIRVYERETDTFLGIAPIVGRATYTNTDEIERRKREHKRYRDLRAAWWKEQERMLDGGLPSISPAERVGLSEESAAAVAGERSRNASGGDAPVVRLTPRAEDAGPPRTPTSQDSPLCEALLPQPEPAPHASAPSGGTVVDLATRRPLADRPSPQQDLAAQCPEPPSPAPDAAALIDAALSLGISKETTTAAPSPDEVDDYFGF